jgi:hypothetical protein
MKAFWLDEWFILHNMKTKSYSALIGELEYSQQFPRIYLIIIKFFAEITHYNYYAIRFFPTIAQIFNILFIVFSISGILFKDNLLKRNLFIVFFLSFQITIFYFTQLKQYSIEMSVALFGIWFFDFLCRDTNQKRIFSRGYIAFLFYLIAAPFFSYTFLFVTAPIIVILFFTLINKKSTKDTKLKVLTPLLIVFISIGLNFFTDLRFVLNSKNQYTAFSENIFSWQSLSSISRGILNLYRLPGYLFLYTPSEFNKAIGVFFFLVKLLIIALTIFGGYHLCKNSFKKQLLKINHLLTLFTLRSGINVSIYLFLSFSTMIFFYLAGKLPIGQARLNYFSILFLIYFLLEGSEIFVQKIPFFNSLILSVLFFASIYQASRGYIREFQNKNLLFDQKMFETIGDVITVAELKRLPIFVKENEFYPSSIMQHMENLAIEAHPSYSIDHSPRVNIFYGESPSRLDSTPIDSSYILLKKHSYSLVRIFNTSQ